MDNKLDVSSVVQAAQAISFCLPQKHWFKNKAYLLLLGLLGLVMGTSETRL